MTSHPYEKVITFTILLAIFFVIDNRIQRISVGSIPTGSRDADMIHDRASSQIFLFEEGKNYRTNAS